MGMYDWASFAVNSGSLAAVAGVSGNAIQFNVTSAVGSECGLIWLDKSNLFETEAVFNSKFDVSGAAKVLAFRSQSLSNFDDCYVVRSRGGDPVLTEWKLYRVVVGVWTEIDSFSEGSSEGVGIWFKHRIRCYNESGKVRFSIERWIGPNPEDYILICEFEDSIPQFDFGMLALGSRNPAAPGSTAVSFDNIELRDYIGPESGYFFDEFEWDEMALVGIPQVVEVVIRPDRKKLQIVRQYKRPEVSRPNKRIEIPL